MEQTKLKLDDVQSSISETPNKGGSKREATSPLYSDIASLKKTRPDAMGGARWLSGRVSDSGARGPGFETYRRRVVSLSKTLYSPKVLVNYPGSDGSVPT